MYNNILNMLFFFLDVIVFEKQRKGYFGGFNFDIRVILNNEGQRLRLETVLVFLVVKQKESFDSFDIQIDKINIFMLGLIGIGQI